MRNTTYIFLKTKRNNLSHRSLSTAVIANFARISLYLYRLRKELCGSSSSVGEASDTTHFRFANKKVTSTLQLAPADVDFRVPSLPSPNC